MPKLRTIASVLSILVIAVGIVVLIGWWLDIDALKTLFPGLASMKGNTAIGFVLLGGSLFSYIKEQPKFLYWSTAVLALLLSTAVLAQYAFSANFGIDELFFADVATAPQDFPGRMSIATAIGFFVFAVSLILLYVNAVRTAQFVTIFGNSFITVPLLGYLFNVEGLYDVSVFSSIVIHTVLTFSAFGTAVLLSRPNSELIFILKDEGSAGKVLRRSIPVAFGVPILLGILTNLAENANMFNYLIGQAILVQAIILVMLAAAWRIARLILQEDLIQDAHTDQLRISGEKFHAIFRESADIIFLINPDDGTIININPTSSLLLKSEPEDLIGQHFKTLFKDNIEQDFLNNVTFVRDVMLDQPIRKADGTFLAMDLTTKIIPWENDRAVLVSLRDVSERKAMQEELLLAQLKQIELEKEHELVNRKETFIAGISHDFKNPLSVISLSSDILHRYHDRLNLDQTLSHLERIRFQAHFMKEMIDDVMTYVESQHGEILTQFQLMDLIDLCKTIIKDLSYQYTNRAVKLEIGKHPGSLMLDPRLMRRAIANLLSNALKYSAADTTVILSVTLDQNILTIEVEDHGIGIPTEDQERLFTPFQRASNVENIKGTGLGLVVVRDCISVHEGTVSFMTSEGQGTTFTIRIPYEINNIRQFPGVHSA
ncbi:MAG: PAS domain-containing sensor histidine kinase [Aggregatilineales bacterium]